MDKRQFLKTSGALFAGGAFSHLAGADANTPRTNWSGNYRYRAEHLHLPKTVAEVQKIVKDCRHIRALGRATLSIPSRTVLKTRFR